MSNWLPWMLQATDSMFPTGAYAHSMGLEGAVEDGFVTDSDSFHTYLINVVLPAMVHLELPCVGFAYDDALKRDFTSLVQLDQNYAAMKVTQEVRNASAKIGAQRLSLLGIIMPDPIWIQLKQLQAEGTFLAHEAVVLGVQGALSGADKRQTMMSAFYLGLSLQANAIFKLIRIGQIQCQTIVSKCLLTTEENIENALKIEREDMGWFSPAMDIFSARHESTYSRIFIS